MKKEEQFSHGGLRQGWLITKIKRALRPKHHKLGMSSAPFDWTIGIEHNCKIKNQGQSESCGGQAGARWLEIALSMPEMSAKAIYSQGYYYPSGGMSKASLENQIAAGINLPESVVPSYDAAGNPLSESMYRELSWKTPAMTAGSYENIIPITVAIDKESIAQAMKSTGGVIMLIEGQNGNPASWDTAAPEPPVKSNPNEIWDHYMTFTGAKSAYQKPLRADQSWGEGIGDAGRQYFGDDYLTSGHITDCFTFIPKSAFKDSRIPLMQQLLALMQQLYNNLTAVKSG